MQDLHNLVIAVHAIGGDSGKICNFDEALVTCKRGDFTSFPTKRKETQDFAEATFLWSERHPYRIYKKKEKLIQGTASKPVRCKALSLIDQITEAVCANTNPFTSRPLYHTFSLSWRLQRKQLKLSCPLCYKKYLRFQYFHHNSVPNRNIIYYYVSVTTYLCLWILQPFIRDFSSHVFRRRT